MIESDEEQGRDLSRLVVARAGRLVATGDAREPYRMVGPGGEVVEPVSVFLRDLLASGKSESTLRSYSVDLLRWWRFLDAVGIAWSRASRVEARDFSCWIQLTAKQRLQTSRPRAARLSSRVPGAPNPVTGKPASGDGYAPSTVAHSETVLRSFYDFHRDCGTGPVLNPFPLDSSRRGRRHAHHNPMYGWAPERSGRYRPVVPKRIPRAIPDDWFNKVFASLPSDRDRALVAFWISTGIRCEELLELTHHSITEYRLPSTGELVPLLQVAPSKTDTERLLLVSPELADVLSAIISRLGGPGGTVPLTVSYDIKERVWNPPMPLLFQRSIGSETRAHTPNAIRNLLINALAATGLTDAVGDPLHYTPHDFRRIFVTDAIMNGLPPHIAQVICGHKTIDTTIGYKNPRELHQAGEDCPD